MFSSSLTTALSSKTTHTPTLPSKRVSLFTFLFRNHSFNSFPPLHIQHSLLHSLQQFQFMGGCLSSQFSADRSQHHRNPSANVVTLNGELRRYSLPATVSQVLQSHSPSRDSFFLCNSDRLYFNDYIPSLDLHEELEPAQIYFLLPSTRLQRLLTASDMAALAVKASLALEQINGSDRRRKRKTRISPVLASEEEDPQSNRTVNKIKGSANYYGRDRNNNANKSSTAGLGVSRSASMRKLTKYSSRRAKLAVRSFRIMLNTIYE